MGLLVSDVLWQVSAWVLQIQRKFLVAQTIRKLNTPETSFQARKKSKKTIHSSFFSNSLTNPLTFLKPWLVICDKRELKRLCHWLSCDESRIVFGILVFFRS